VIEKGACSFTLIQQGVLSAERAATVRSRQDVPVEAGDTYSAAALSIVLHSRSPMVPTFRSDVRIFLVSNGDKTMAFFGGGADLTPYYLMNEDISYFHRIYKNLCDQFNTDKKEEFTYEHMKKACDEYFYLPARSEHRGTGGIFFDDMEATPEAMEFVEAVVNAWMPSWLPITAKRRNTEYSEHERHWQLLRRGRYLEFNLLYDRGVRFGLANANPRVEGVMVSAPPLVAWEYNHQIEERSPEAKIMKVLKSPVEWI
jgi:coproporphyrinogen III oxidase